MRKRRFSAEEIGRLVDCVDAHLYWALEDEPTEGEHTWHIRSAQKAVEELRSMLEPLLEDTK